MPLSTINNGDSGSTARAAINAVIAEVNLLGSAAYQNTTAFDAAGDAAAAMNALLAGNNSWGDLQTFARISFAGNISAGAWLTGGLRTVGVAGTLTDTTSSGTVSSACTHKIAGDTIAASNATTFTNYFSTYVTAPVAGTNVTLTSAWALGADSLYVGTSNPFKVAANGAVTAQNLVTATNAGNSFLALYGDTKDGVALAGRNGGSSSYIATITTAALTASRTFTIPAVTGNDTFALLGIANGFTAAQSVTLTALGTTPTAGHSLINSTAATSGNQQVSPSLVQQGNGFGTSGSASQTVAFRQYVLPVQGTAPTGSWTLQKSVNGAAFTDVLSVDSAGNVTAAGIIHTGASAGSGYLTAGNNSFWAGDPGSGLAGAFLNQYGKLYFYPGGISIGGSTQLVMGPNANIVGALQLGVDAAGVAHQTILAANRITSDGVGANLTLTGGNGRGGAGGSLILSTYDTGAASTAGTLRSRMVFDTAGAISFPVVTAVTTEVVVSDTTWPVTINGTSYKILLKS